MIRSCHFQFFRNVAACAFAIWGGFGVSTALAGETTVFAAASLKTALDEIVTEFQTQTQHKVTRSYAASSALARQIEFGAPAHIFISANAGWMDHLEKNGLIAPETRRDLLSNKLVLVAPSASSHTISISADLDLIDQLGDGYLAMAMVNSVPAGIYGKAALEHFGLWSSVTGRVAQTDNVRAALALVSLGEAPLGLVYKTDAQADPNTRIVATFPATSHPPIRYPVAALKGKTDPATLAFLDHLAQPSSHAIFAKHGFEVIREQND